MSAKIYCIECRETGEKYIGSTIEKYLSSRISSHRFDAKNRNCSSKQIIERGKYKYYLIEEVELSQKLIREQYWIDNTDKCINERSAYGFNRKEYQKYFAREYRQRNKDKIQNYLVLNKDKIKESDNNRYNYQSSWGGNKKNNNNLLLIDLSLFSD